MTAGHFGFAALVKGAAPQLPLWALMLATYLLDVVFIVLLGLGIEGLAPIDPAHPGYGQVLIHAYYTHSLVGALAIAALAGGGAWLWWGRRAAMIIAGVVFSHWVLDLLTHRADLPILPGNFGAFPVLGLGLWRQPVLSGFLELALVVGGGLLYLRAASGYPPRVIAGGVTLAAMLLLLAADVMALPTPIILALMLVLIAGCGWLDTRIHDPEQAGPPPRAHLRGG